MLRLSASPTESEGRALNRIRLYLLKPFSTAEDAGVSTKHAGDKAGSQRNTGSIVVVNNEVYIISKVSGRDGKEC